MATNTHQQTDQRPQQSQYRPPTAGEQTRFDALLDRVPDDAQRVIDVGCVRHTAAERHERGNLHAALARRIDGDLLGIDIDADEIQRMSRQGWNVRVEDAQQLSVDEPVDAIVAGEVIEHLDRVGDFLRSARDALAEDGTIIVSTPNPDGFVWWRKAALGQSNNPEHTCWISPENLSELVSRVGGLEIAETSFLPPSGGVSGLLWLAGNRRAAAQTYVAELVRS